MMESQKITFSVVICTLHNLAGLVKCASSIAKQTVKPYEVIIVHGENSGNIVEKIFPILESKSINCKYISSIRSLVIQRNIGIDNSSGNVIVFLDDDVILEKDYFYYLLKIYKTKWHDNLGGVQGTIIENKKRYRWTLKEILKYIFLLGSTNGDGNLLPSGNASFCGNPNGIKKVEIFSGCVMSFKKDILINNRFDENFSDFWICDDTELSYRISRKHDLYQTPFAQLQHVGSSLSYEGHLKIAKMLVFNRLYVFRLYFSSSKKNWFLFIWSNIGELFFSIYKSIIIGNVGKLVGFLQGWKLVLLNNGHPYKKYKKIKRREK